MQEEGRENMDVKPTQRAPSVPAKASGAESKKSENGNGNRLPRNGRKREPNAPRPRYEGPGRKTNPNAAKPRGFDKRPRSRGYSNTKQKCEVTEVDPADFNSAVCNRNKKGSLNHLLNFSFSPRENVSSSHPGQAHWKTRNNWSGKKTVKYNKEQFLQANCQFVVKEGTDYTVHSADPDSLVDWDLIEEVRIPSHAVPNCPVCLYPPVAAKLTRCGHIYCWVCMLHYLALGEKTWRKCPICYEAVHKKDLKSVVALQTHQYTASEQITMVLMKKERGSTFAMPRSQWMDREAKPHYVDDEVDTNFAKLLLARTHHIQAIIDKEKQALLKQMEDDEDTIECSFIKAALEELEVREKALRFAEQSKMAANALIAEVVSPEQPLEDLPLENPKTPERKVAVEYASAFSDEEVEPEKDSGETKEKVVQAPAEADPADVRADRPRHESESGRSEDGVPLDVAMEQLALPSDNSFMAAGGETEPTGASSQKYTSTYYFFQAADGQHIYLNSLNARCLIKEYGGLEHCPDTITATIVELESISMTEELRRRLRYLNHLPLTCEFQVAELALKPPILSGETIRLFSDEIDKRRRNRQRKDRQERRFSRKAQQSEDSKNGIYPSLRANLSSTSHFPACGQLETRPESPLLATSPDSVSTGTPIGSPPATSLNPYAMEFTPASPYTASSLDDGRDSGSMSFAQMLRQGKANPPVVWPKAKKPESEPKLIQAKKSPASDESDNEDRVPVPMFQASFQDAIQVALDKYTEEKGTPEPGKGKKKKKKEKKLLFTTSMARQK